MVLHAKANHAATCNYPHHQTSQILRTPSPAYVIRLAPKRLRWEVVGCNPIGFYVLIGRVWDREAVYPCNGSPFQNCVISGWSILKYTRYMVRAGLKPSRLDVFVSAVVRWAAHNTNQFTWVTNVAQFTIFMTRCLSSHYITCECLKRNALFPEYESIGAWRPTHLPLIASRAIPLRWCYLPSTPITPHSIIGWEITTSWRWLNPPSLSGNATPGRTRPQLNWPRICGTAGFGWWQFLTRHTVTQSLVTGLENNSHLKANYFVS